MRTGFFDTSRRGGEFVAEKESQVTAVDHRKQFSKRLASLGAIVWTIYVFGVLALIAYQPEAAMACVWLTLITTVNKMLDTVAYTRNSITEKMLLAGIERTKFEIGLKGIGKSVNGSVAGTHSNDDEDDDDQSEGGGNG